MIFNMKVYLSYARKDVRLANDLANRLEKKGFSVWRVDEEIIPGDNWGKKVGKALDEAELMVFLLTPKAMGSEMIRRDFEYAFFNLKLENRVFSIMVGVDAQSDRDIPWILFKQPHCKIATPKQLARAVKKIEALEYGAKLSYAHA